MPVIASATRTLLISQDDIRMFLRDVAGQVPGTGVSNILFDLPEFSDEDIQRALKFTTARYNIITPITNNTIDTVNIWLLLIGCSEFLMISEAFRQGRNQVTYADGDVAPIGLDDKQQQYLALANTLKTEFEEKTKAYKISQNMEACFGSLGSGYRNASRFFHAN